MAGIFPGYGRSAGVDNAGLTLARPNSQLCDALYYDETCPQRVDSRALNGLISELVAVLNAATSRDPTAQYDCARRDNLLRALATLYAMPPPPPTGAHRLTSINGALSWQPV
jgi:hypothetical protein